MTPADWESVRRYLAEMTGQSIGELNVTVLCGGDINRAYRASDRRQHFFVKVNRAEMLPMFEAELLGLSELAATNTVRVPQPVGCGLSGHYAFLVAEYIELEGNPESRLFARQLAAMHRHGQQLFGYRIDNTIGSSVQRNTESEDWIQFWQQQRLGFQLELAAANGYGHELFEVGMRLVEKVADFFCVYTPCPALLHGDLWSGNVACDADRNPVIFDPACYYGDHEVDLAMLELFGRPEPHFFEVYNEHFVIDPGYQQRRDLYNLYHILNHANLFGGGYVEQSRAMITRLLALI